jgi:hypothetical protein
VVVALVVFSVAFILARFAYFPYTPEGQRLARVETARVHARTVVTPLLAKDKRFEFVSVSEWYKDGGYFLVRGAVDSQTDFRDLKQLVMGTHPPAPIAWVVYVVETNMATNGVSR